METPFFGPFHAYLPFPFTLLSLFPFTLLSPSQQTPLFYQYYSNVHDIGSRRSGDDVLSVEVLQVVVSIVRLQEVIRLHALAQALLVRLAVHHAASSVARTVRTVRTAGKEGDTLLAVELDGRGQRHLLVATAETEVGAEVHRRLSA